MVRREDKTDEFMSAIAEASAFIDGDIHNTRVRKIVPDRTPILEARLRLGMKQQEFASCLGISVSGLRKWEQGQRAPNGAVLVLMRLIADHPDIVRAAFQTEKPLQQAAE